MYNYFITSNKKFINTTSNIYLQLFIYSKNIYFFYNYIIRYVIALL